MTKKKTVFMETTEVAAEKTASQIAAVLVTAGARQIQTDYGPEGQPIGLRFALAVSDYMLTFALPVRTERLHELLVKRRKGRLRAGDTNAIRLQSERIAWRQLLRWVEAQVAMIEVGMVQSQEVFLPYLFNADLGQTMFEHFNDEGIKQLKATAAKV